MTGIKITVRSAAIAPKIAARELVSRTGICRVNACTHQEERWQKGEKDERERRTREREGKKGWEEEKKKRAAGREVVRIQSSKLAGERVIAFRDYSVEFVALFLFCPSFCEDEREKDTRQGKKLQNCSHTRFLAREYSRKKEKNGARRSLINQKEARLHIIIFPSMFIEICVYKRMLVSRNMYAPHHDRIVFGFQGFNYGRFSRKLLQLMHACEEAIAENSAWDFHSRAVISPINPAWFVRSCTVARQFTDDGQL